MCTYTTRLADRAWKVLAIFIHPHPFNDDQLDEALARELSKEGPIDTVHFVGFQESLMQLRTCCTDDSVSIERLRQSIPDLASQLRMIGLGKDGQLQMWTVEWQVVEELELLAQTRRQSLQRVFFERNGLITANKGVHYTKPSGKHAAQFLRAANVFEDSSIALQIAFWLFPYTSGKKIKRIVVDTSGIDSVAFVLAYEGLRLKLQTELPLIESHSSYGGLERLVIPDPDHTFFFISASTSGGLYQSLVKRGAHASHVVTLYYLGPDNADAGPVLTDLTYQEKFNECGLAPIENYTASDCPHCKQHSYAIPIVGDQFSTEPARVEEIEVLLSDFSDEQRQVLGRLVSTGVFKVFRSIEGKDMEHFLDVEALMFYPHKTSPEAVESANWMNLRWGRLIRRSMPLHLARIVTTRNPGARRLATAVHGMLSAAMQTQVELLSSRELQAVLPAPDSATLVISACLDEGHELMAISRDLRTVQPGGNTAYVAPLFRSSLASEHSRIQSNLTFGEYGPGTFNLFTCLKIELPACDAQHSWHRELNRLQALTHWADMDGRDVPSEIEDRINALRNAPATGLEDGLYWPDINGEELKLASDFTVVPNRDGLRHFSQADVFTIAASLFHQYRQGVKGKPRLIYLPYERTVISPESFQRFSDGVLQAAFLRAARGSEIGYANCDVSVSERMHTFLMAEVDAASYGRGPALMEYVISMLIGRLTLYVDHQYDFLTRVAKDSRLPAPVRLCAEFASK
jgi:hypothetical protein